MPTHPLPDLGQLSVALQSLRLPALAGVRHLGQSGPIDRVLVSFEGPQADLMLTRVVWNPGYDPLQNALAAIQALEAESLPIPRGIQILPDRALDRPASLVPMGAGVGAGELLKRSPTAISHVLGAMGTVLAELEQLYQVRAGTRGDAGWFVPSRSTWRDEWRGLAEAQRIGADEAGLGDLPATDRLWDAIEGELSGLPEQIDATLVHFGLRPASLRFSVQQSGLRLTRIDEWDQAMAADPLAAWAPLLTRFDAVHLREVITTYGTDRIEALLEPATVDRIQLYARTRALFELRDAAQRARHSPSVDAARSVARAADSCARWSEDDGARSRLQGALDGTASPSRAAPPDAPADLLDRRVVLGYSAGPLPPSDRAPHLLGALAAAGLLRRTEGATAAHFSTVGGQFVEAANLPPDVLPALRITDRAQWRASLIAAAARAGGGGPALGLGLLAAGLGATDRLGDQVSSRSLRGLEAMVLAVLAREAPRRNGEGLSAKERVIHGLIGQDAALILGLDDLAARYSSQLSNALDVLGGPRNPPKEGDSSPSMAELLPILTKPLVYAGVGLLLLPTALAVVRSGERGILPDQPSKLIEAAFSR